MLELESVCREPELELIRPLYLAAFPLAERRPFETYARLLNDPAYGLDILRADGAPIGVFSYWRLDGFTFIEHFAVEAQQRGQGLGSAALQAFIASHSGQIVLEVEPANSSALARRRIAFYERQGFVLSQVEYVQPPYLADGAAVSLKLMSYPAALADYAAVRAELYRRVYGVAADWSAA